MLHYLIARRRVGPQTQCRPRHKAFTSGLGLDALSVTWPTVVQLVVSFNSGLQWGISQEYSFFVSSQWSIWFCVFSLRCIDWIRKPLCEPNFFMYIFVLAFNPPPRGVYATDIFKGGGPNVVLILCSSIVYNTRRFMFGLTLLFVYVFRLSF